MKRKELMKIGVVVLVIVILIFILNYFYGALAFLNEPLNDIISGSPNKSCNDDSDCVLRKTICHQCDCGDTVNKNWYTFCPFVDKSIDLCKMCASLHSDFEVKCINNLCQKV